MLRSRTPLARKSQLTRKTPLRAKPLKKKKPKPTRTLLCRRADDLVRIIVRQRDRVCRACRGSERLEDAHLIPRRNRAVRWDLDNHVLLCHSCHRYYTVHEYDWRDWIVVNLSSALWDRLREKARAPWNKDYDLVFQYLNGLRAELVDFGGVLASTQAEGYNAPHGPTDDP